METYVDSSADWFAAGGLVETRSLGEKLIADGWAPEVLSRDEDGRIADSVWWPPHLAKERRLSGPS